jgi:hypothetical protein
MLAAVLNLIKRLQTHLRLLSSRGAQPDDSRSTYPDWTASGAAACGEVGVGEEDDVLACSSVYH